MRRVGPVMTTPTVRRASAAVLGVLLAVGGTALTAPAAAAPPQKTAVIVQLTPGSDAAAESRRAAANGGGSVSHVYTRPSAASPARSPSARSPGLQQEPPGHARRARWLGRSSASGRPEPPRLGPRPDRCAARASTAVLLCVLRLGVHCLRHRHRCQAGHEASVPGSSRLRLVRRHDRDCNGHGDPRRRHDRGCTTTASPSRCHLVPVRVLDCTGSGSWSGVIAGLDWAKGDHAAGAPAVANLSLGGGRRAPALTPRCEPGGRRRHRGRGGRRQQRRRSRQLARPACRRSPSAPPTAPTGGPSFSNFGSACRPVRARRRHHLGLVAPRRHATSSPARRWRRRTSRAPRHCCWSRPGAAARRRSPASRARRASTTVAWRRRARVAQPSALRPQPAVSVPPIPGRPGPGIGGRVEGVTESTPARRAVLHTNHGDITVDLFPDHAPKTVANFAGLAEGAREWTHPRDRARRRPTSSTTARSSTGSSPAS